MSETGYPRSSLSGRHLALDADGAYRILVSKDEPARLAPNEQWLRIPADAEDGEVSILARHKHFFVFSYPLRQFVGKRR